MIAVNSSIHQSPSPFETSEFVHGAVSSASPAEAKVEEHIRRRHHVSRTERASDITLMSNDGHDEQADQVAEKLCSRRQHINKRVRSLDDTLVVADSKLYEDRSFSTWSGRGGGGLSERKLYTTMRLESLLGGGTGNGGLGTVVVLAVVCLTVGTNSGGSFIVGADE
jgi:hypothetical protein